MNESKGSDVGDFPFRRYVRLGARVYLNPDLKPSDIVLEHWGPDDDDDDEQWGPDEQCPIEKFLISRGIGTVVGCSDRSDRPQGRCSEWWFDRVTLGSNPYLRVEWDSGDWIDVKMYAREMDQQQWGIPVFKYAEDVHSWRVEATWKIVKKLLPVALRDDVVGTVIKSYMRSEVYYSATAGANWVQVRDVIFRSFKISLPKHPPKGRIFQGEWKPSVFFLPGGMILPWETLAYVFSVGFPEQQSFLCVKARFVVNRMYDHPRFSVEIFDGDRPVVIHGCIEGIHDKFVDYMFVNGISPLELKLACVVCDLSDESPALHPNDYIPLHHVCLGASNPSPSECWGLPRGMLDRGNRAILQEMLESYLKLVERAREHVSDGKTRYLVFDNMLCCEEIECLRDYFDIKRVKFSGCWKAPRVFDRREKIVEAKLLDLLDEHLSLYLHKRKVQVVSRRGQKRKNLKT
uniref:Uncharacterized protein n=1 Tax=Lotharella oceanica TaxID=641309 RepID=A0A7S2TX53_9EUKA